MRTVHSQTDETKAFNDEFRLPGTGKPEFVDVVDDDGRWLGMRFTAGSRKGQVSQLKLVTKSPGLKKAETERATAEAKRAGDEARLRALRDKFNAAGTLTESERDEALGLLLRRV